jgi:hypothetical protein
LTAAPTFIRAALSVSFIAVKDSQRCRSTTTEMAMDLPAHRANAYVRWRMAPEIFNASSISFHDSSVLPVVRQDRGCQEGNIISCCYSLYT